MKYLDLSLPHASQNLACDEALLERCEAGLDEEILRFWQPDETFVVVGYANQVAAEVNLDGCVADKIGVYRRCSGGGTVLQGAGCLNYSLVLRIPEAGPLCSINGTNNFILENHCAALAPVLGRAASIRGYSDLSLGDLKFSGNAQRRKRKFLIFHGTFLLQFDLPLIARYLRMPSKEPDYRRNRAHEHFVTNLNVPPSMVKSALQKIWGADDATVEIPRERIQELVADKYALDEWNLKF